MSGVERAARRALDEVQDAVAGYRAVSLVEELENAGRVLTSAGVRVEISRGLDPIPAGVESVLAWAVRGGTTNVLRHSDARRWMIDVRLDGDGHAIAEIHDDGGAVNGTGDGRDERSVGGRRPHIAQVVDGAAGGGREKEASTSGRMSRRTGIDVGGGAGSGLRGLTERVMAAGGTLEAGPLSGGGYRMRACIPMSVARGGRDLGAVGR
ncbi:hypothetical protein C1I98_29300 [Spongiactinospora gelatinilytica]|uniref:Signal transduction histidine kinase subgroup 3 dimerisation and phosphoacceptor domain-containing protein n=1 Tax=Spongiactinospora gelatinilytica TaxID=2666298 RepID=A0A2W2F9J9_9ACTN|nr:hypothetical protein [Spongiactinospora gelatinilytica]PZG32532.1 hypothetical protein C1I98_29300 [Spongiactinospora gelatinilytica]